MQITFEQQSIIVTGGAKGIGAATAIVLADAGARVRIFDVDAEAGEVLAARQAGVSFEAVDITRREAVTQAVARAAADNGVVTGLVNNAGVAPALTLESMTPEQWQNVLALNLGGAYHCVDAVVPGMRAERRGAIVNVSSVAGKNISLGAGFHYTTSKWGLIGFSRHLAYELAPAGIRVNVVCPGPTETTLLGLDAQTQARAASGVPLGRLVQPEDVANAIAFLLSPLASMCTGAEIVVDGGVLLGSGDGYDGYFQRRGGSTPERVVQPLPVSK
jgi:NAD(P)-dependent dehydrogenase (short-subunit alcohol dehydrogenase family)